MTLLRHCTRAMAAVLAVCLLALCTGCGQSVVQFPLDDGGKSTTVATQAGTVIAGNVTASNYELDFQNFSLLKNVEGIVESASGAAELVAGSAPGQDYAIYLGTLSSSSTLAEVEAAYSGAKAAGSLSELTALQLPAEWFELVGVTLDTTVERTVIVRNTEQSVSSYQLLVVSFY